MTTLVRAASGVTPDHAVKLHDAIGEVRNECWVAACAIREAAEGQGLPDTMISEIVGKGILKTAALVTAQRAAK